MKRLPQAIEDLVTNTVLAVDDRRLLRYDVRRACYKAYRLGQRRARARAALLDWRAAQRGSKVIVEAVRTGKIKLGLDSHPLRIDTIEGLGPRVKVGTRWTAAGRQAVSDFVREKGGHSKPASLGPTSGPQNFLLLSRKILGNLGKNPVMKSKMRRRIEIHDAIVARFPERQSVCPNCGQPGAHFVSPSLGDEGFFICDKKCDDLSPPSCAIPSPSKELSPNEKK